ncbi:MAG: PD40 domain-containing protein, partial [Anaerolineae bacterium]|nr:PD40 domain-containing protein [Anaerolineae bacterium]
LQTRSCLSSPPHRRDTYTIFNLDTLTSTVETEDFGPGQLDTPAVAQQAGRVVSVYHHANGFEQLVIFNRQGQLIDTTEPHLKEYGSSPVVDAKGEWLYTLNGRAIEVRSLTDLTLQSRIPLTTNIPTEIVLSQDERHLYLFGNGMLQAHRVFDLQRARIDEPEDIPLNWLSNPDDGSPQVKLFRSPEFRRDGESIILLDNPFEAYRLPRLGVEYLPAMTRMYWPHFDTIALSLSPNYSRDHTLVAMLTTQPMRSTDKGQTWEPWNPPLAFTSDRDGNREIYTMTPDGDQLQRLTDNPTADENAAWSPAWTRLAFQSDRDGNWDIYLLDPTCAETECSLQRLTHDPGDDMLPAWSPDGRRIAFVSTRDGNPEIYVMDKDGGNIQRLTFNDHGDWRPAWLPDSQHLIFTSNRSGTNDIYQITVPLLDLDPFAPSDPELTPLITGDADDRDPAVGPDGTIYFLSDRDDGIMKIFTYKLKTSANGTGEPVIEALNATDAPQAHPSPTLNQNTPILAALTPEGQSDIYLLGYSTVPLTNEPGFDGQPAAGPTGWNPSKDLSYDWLLQRAGD